MHTNPLFSVFKVLLICHLLASISSASAGDIDQYPVPRIISESDGVSATFAVSGAPSGTLLDVTIIGPGGDPVFNDRSAAQGIEWIPEPDAKEGRYTWEGYVVFPELNSQPKDPENPSIERYPDNFPTPGRTLTGGKMRLENGFLSISRPDPREAKEPTKNDSDRPTAGQKIFEVNDDIQINDLTPVLLFNDTSTGHSDFSIQVNNDLFDIRDSSGFIEFIRIDQAAADKSLGVGPDSSNGNARVGIGTATPIRDIEIQSTTPSLMFDESDFGAKYQLGLRDGTLRYQSIDTLDIPIRIEHGAPQNSLFIENTGDVGLGTSSPTAALHIADTIPQISLSDTDDDQTWILRNYDLEGSTFQVFDPGAVTRPFQIQPGAPSNTLYLADSGKVGIGTNQPLGAVHIAQVAPGLTFDDTDDSQVWEMYSSGGPVFLVDVTNSTVPIIVKEGARTNAIHIGDDGRIGLGTNLPVAPLHVVQTDNATGAFIEDASGTTATRQLLTLANNGPVELGLVNSSGTSWRLSTENNGFAVRKGSGATKLAVRSNGDLEAAGTLTEGSSIAIKENIVPVNGATVLAKLDALPLSEWSYIGDSEDRHLGPMAEDFYALFGLGPDDRQIAPKDLAGVALVAAKTLRAEVKSLKSENEQLRERLAGMDRLERRMRELEILLGETKAVSD